MSEKKESTPIVFCSQLKDARTKGHAEKCKDCNDDIWLSDTSIPALKENFPNADLEKNPPELVCLKCGIERMNQANEKNGGKDIKFGKITLAQVDEVVDHIKKKHGK